MRPSLSSLPAGAIRRVTRILLVVQGVAVLGIYAASIAFLHLSSGWAALALGLLAVLLLRMFIISNNFVMAWWHRSPTPVAYRIGFPAFLRMFLREYAASMTSSSWTMAFRGFEQRIYPDSQALPVLLVHGYGCNSGYWHSMSRILAREHISHFAVDLEPVFGAIDGFVPAMDKAVRHVLAETGASQLIVLAHSMGGLVARAWMREHGSQSVARLITLGTPHLGTALANFGWGDNSRQMRWEGRGPNGCASQWLRELNECDEPSQRELITSIWSHHDNIVSPQESSRLPGARNIEVSGIGHVSLAFAPQVQALAVREIRAASQAANAHAAT